MPTCTHPDILYHAKQTHLTFWRTIAKTTMSDHGIEAISTHLENNFLNTVIHANIPTYRLKKTLQKVYDFFTELQVPWSWDVTPFHEPNNLAALLTQQGLEVVLSCPNMYLDLTDPIPTFPLATNTIIEVSNLCELKQWNIPIQYSFGENQLVDNGFYEIFANLPFGPHRVFRHYVAFQDEQPVSSASLSFCASSARIDNMATHKQYQKKGYATALTYHMLQTAQNLGAKTCFLESSPDGYAIYKKFGFIEFGQTHIMQKT